MAEHRNGNQMYNYTTLLSDLPQGYLHMLGFAETEKQKERKIPTDGQINPVLGNYETCTAESEKAVCLSQMCISSFQVPKEAFSKIPQL